MAPTTSRSATTARSARVTSTSKKVLSSLGLAAALTLSVGCSTSNDTNNNPSVPMGGETGDTTGSTLSPTGMTVGP
jgi:hypothetical protein